MRVASWVRTNIRPSPFHIPPVHVPEQELPVEVGHVYGVHVNDVDVHEAWQGQVFEHFAAQTSCAHTKDLAVLWLDVLPQLWARLKAWTHEVALPQ